MIGNKITRVCAVISVAAAQFVLADYAQAQTSASPYTTGVRYDAMSRVTGTIAPDPDGGGSIKHAATRTTYDAAGRPIRQEMGELATWQSELVAPANWPADLSGFAVHSQTDTVFDAMNRKTREALSSGGTVYGLTQYSYDVVGRLECTAVRMNPAIYGSLPASACSLGTEGTQGPDRITKNVYDTAGQLVQVRKAVGVVGLEQAYATYDYTPNGMQSTVIDANGNRATRTYDGFDRQDGFYLPGPALVAGFNPSTPSTALATAGASSTTDYETYGYDANGNRTSLRKRDARVLTYEYDALNRMTRKVVPDACVAGYACTPAPASATRDVYYDYDLRGLQLHARFDSATGQGVTNTYDGFGQLKTTVVDLGGNTRQIDYDYDGDGNRTKITHPDQQVFNYTYDGLDRSKTIRRGEDAALQIITYNARGLPDKSFDQVVTYGYDAPGRLWSLNYQLSGATYDVTTTLDYNPAQQMSQATISNDLYSYRERGPGSRGYTINGLNQYTGAGTSAMTYDANGNLMSSGTTGYVYDVENRLVGVTGSGGTELSYDPMGRLFQTSVGGGSVTQFLYDGSALIAEYNGANGLARRYVHGVGGDVPLASYEGASIDATNRRQLFADRQGSIVATTTSDFAVIQINNYDEYGVPAAGNFGRFQYTGQTWLPEVGLYHYKARAYSPTLGRFLQTDPIGYGDGLNLYAYTGNDPVNNVDDDGQHRRPVNAPTPGTPRTVAGMAYAAQIANWNARGRAIDPRYGGYSYMGEPGARDATAARMAFGRMQARAADRAGSDLAPNQPGAQFQTNGGRGGNDFRPISDFPHTVFRPIDGGRITNYETYNYPRPNQGVRVDVEGASHGGVPTPHVVTTQRHVNPNDPGRSSVTESRPRPAREDELPGRKQ